MPRMKRTYGDMPSLPRGYFKAIHFPALAYTDQRTGDGRLLEHDGGDTRSLPVPIMFKPATSAGHDGAVLAGALFRVEFGEDGTVSGDGYLLDDDNGRYMARAVYTQAMRGNSVDLAEVQVKMEWSEDMEDYTIRFTDWSIAATTGVPVPAFADAMAEIDDLSDDELLASLGDLPLVCEFTEWDAHTILAEPDLTAAAGCQVAPFEAFFQEEPDGLRKVTIDENGWVSGHLAAWGSCHDGIEGRCVTPPRQANYGSFNKPGVLTDQGIVETGPIFFAGGHQRGPDLEEAYGGVENAWADVRVSEGRYGIWLSGVVRPGVDDATVYAARASRVSGHWVRGQLKAIVSVNAEGFDVPGSGFSFTTDDQGNVLEMVASFPLCADATTDDDSWAAFGIDDDDVADVLALDSLLPDDPDEVFAAGIDTRPPAEVSDEARQGLSWRREHKRGGRTASVVRARDLSHGKRLSLRSVKAMKSYFDKHAKDKNSRDGWTPGTDSYPSAGRVAWALNGGDAGQRFADTVLSQVQRAKENAAADGARLALLASLDDD